LGRGEGGWENKIQSKVENAKGKRLMEWIEEIERGMDLYRYQGRNSDRLRNSERRSMERGRRIQNRRERVESDHLEIALRKRRGGKEQTRKRVGVGIKLFIFLHCCFMFKI
jgi:hypothetical protein